METSLMMPTRSDWPLRIPRNFPTVAVVLLSFDVVGRVPPNSPIRASEPWTERTRPTDS